MWCRLADHISGEEGPVNLPDSNDVQKDLMSMPEAIPTASGKKKFPLKTEIRKNSGISPDIGDGYALTHKVYMLAKTPHLTTGSIKKKDPGPSSLKTLRRLRGYNKPNKLGRTHSPKRNRG